MESTASALSRAASAATARMASSEPIKDMRNIHAATQPSWASDSRSACACADWSTTVSSRAIAIPVDFARRPSCDGSRSGSSRYSTREASTPCRRATHSSRDKRRFPSMRNLAVGKELQSRDSNARSLDSLSRPNLIFTMLAPHRESIAA